MQAQAQKSEALRRITYQEIRSSPSPVRRELNRMNVFSKSRSRQLQQQLNLDSHGSFKSTASCEYAPQGRNVSLTAFLDRESRITGGRRCGGFPTTSTIPDSLCRSSLKG